MNFYLGMKIGTVRHTLVRHNDEFVHLTTEETK